MLDRNLERAEKIVRAGQPIPLDLAARLMSAGYIIEEIEENALKPVRS